MNISRKANVLVVESGRDERPYSMLKITKGRYGLTIDVYQDTKPLGASHANRIVLDEHAMDKVVDFLGKGSEDYSDAPHVTAIGNMVSSPSGDYE